MLCCTRVEAVDRGVDYNAHLRRTLSRRWVCVQSSVEAQGSRIYSSADTVEDPNQEHISISINDTHKSDIRKFSGLRATRFNALVAATGWVMKPFFMWNGYHFVECHRLSRLARHTS